MSQHTTRHLSFLDLIWEYKISLVVYIICISTLTFIALYALGGVPDELKMQSDIPQTDAATQVDTQPNAETQQGAQIQQQFSVSGTSTVDSQQGELPMRIIIDKIGVNTTVQDPASTNSTLLDDLLLRGAVRYPGSGTLGHGNLFIFAHNTSLPIVNNQAYKAFNGLKNLNIGDTIRVQSSDKEYTYKVTSISLAMSDMAFIDLTTKQNMITLTTCNVLGEKQERYIVQGAFESSKSL